MRKEKQVPIYTPGPHGALVRKRTSCSLIVEEVIDRPAQGSTFRYGIQWCQ